ncbi:MAG: hypothetical protein COT43_06305 [Candidatus Marinimicrobia bacterium CG08_land_8_20_14_0_20_45_22]|nr:MAG: hypothetical protein COT43_06305 [Candidatus Marinimicrobia bacterium CG08_land_8_20_14_0_20_45_22]
MDSVLYKVKFLNKNKGWVAGYYTLLNTVDGGNNWEINNGINGWFVDIDFFDDKNGLLIERSGFILRTIDGGENWQIINSEPLSERLTSLSIIDQERAWIGGWQGLGYVTDKGASVQWYNVSSVSLVKDIQFVDNEKGFLVNDIAQFLITIDGGWTWSEVPRGSGLEMGPIQYFYMIDKENGWIYLDYKGGYLSNIKVNNTISTLENDQYKVPAISDIYFLDSNTGWAIGSGGTILRFTGDKYPISNKSSDMINIFPNPFDIHGTNINFTLQKEQIVIIQVYNIIGQKVKMLYNGLLNKGEITLFWDCNSIASGIYFIHVRCDEFNQVKKCTILK